MASLIETLIDVLDKENEQYLELLKIAPKKASQIALSDIKGLNDTLLEEQKHIDIVNKLEDKRIENVNDICDVLNIKKKNITIENIIDMLKGHPKECELLRSANDRIKRTLNQLMQINDNNKNLLEQKMEMVEFELNLARNAVMAPQTANYSGSSAYSESDNIALNSFDAKQ